MSSERKPITTAQVCALCLLAAAGGGPHRRLQRLAVWSALDLQVARSLVNAELVATSDADVVLSSRAILAVGVVRAMRRRMRWPMTPRWASNRRGQA